MPTIFDTNPKKLSEAKPQEQPPVSAPAEPMHGSTETHALQSINQLIHSSLRPMGLFAAYAMRPKGIAFANQEPDETILLFLRRHFITNVPWIIATFLLFLLPPLFLALVMLIPSFTLPAGLTFVIIAFYYLVVLSYAFSNFISWFYNIGIVTQKRIIDLDSLNILAHNTATANFNEIVDVKFHQRGFFQSTFDYGDIRIQTEAIHANFSFDAAPKPTEVADIISDLRVAMKGYHGNT